MFKFSSLRFLFFGFVITSAQLGIFGQSPAVAIRKDCGSSKLHQYGLVLFTPVSSQQFAVACREHDACYDTFGKSRQECDKAFHNRMLGICARDHNTIFGRPLRAKCNGMADVYYRAVQKGGDKAYRDSQKRRG